MRKAEAQKQIRSLVDRIQKKHGTDVSVSLGIDKGTVKFVSIAAIDGGKESAAKREVRDWAKKTQNQAEKTPPDASTIYEAHEEEDQQTERPFSRSRRCKGEPGSGRLSYLRDAVRRPKNRSRFSGRKRHALDQGREPRILEAQAARIGPGVVVRNQTRDVGRSSGDVPRATYHRIRIPRSP